MSAFHLVLRSLACVFARGVLALCTAKAQSPNLPAGTRFIMSHFEATPEMNVEKLFISVSPDGLNWQTINGGNPVWAPNPWENFRDPSIVYANGWYWVAFTSGNYGAQASFGLLKSQDLLNWTYVGPVSTMIPGATDPLTWGPFFFKDADGTVHLFVSISPINGSQYNPVPALRTYAMRPLNADFTQWSAPVQMSLPGTNINEFWVWKEGDTYHGIYVDFQKAGQYFHTTSNNLFSGWTLANTLGFGSWEGGFVLKRPKGGYRLYFEPGNGVLPLGYRAWECADDFTGFTGPVMMKPARNGKVIAALATTTFADWQSAELSSVPSALRAPTADPDKDGISNLVEFAMGLPSLSPDPVPLETWMDASGYQRVRYYRLPAAAGVNLALEQSDTFASWNPAGADFETRSATLMTDGREWVELRSAAPISGAPKFLRVRASMLP